MVDLLIDESLHPNQLEGFIASRIDSIHPDAIVRLRLKDPENDKQKAFLSDKFLRSLLPETMNYQYGREFYR